MTLLLPSALLIAACLGQPQSETIASRGHQSIESGVNYWLWCKPGSWVKILWKKRHQNGEEVYTVTKTLLRMEDGIPRVRIENSQGGRFEQSESIGDSAPENPPPKIEEKTIGQETLTIAGKKYACRIIQRERSQDSLCGKDSVKTTITTEKIWKCPTTTTNGGVLKVLIKRTWVHQDGTQTDSGPWEEEAVLDLLAPVRITGKRIPCVKVRFTHPRRTDGKGKVEEIEWRCSKIPGGWAKRVITGKRDHENGLVVTEIANHVVDFAVK